MPWVFFLLIVYSAFSAIGSEAPLRASFSEAFELRRDGLGSEGVPETEIEKMRAYAKDFVSIRNGRGDPKRNSDFVVNCLTQETPNWFCPFISPSWKTQPEWMVPVAARVEEGSKEDESREKDEDLSRGGVLESLKAGRWSAIQGATRKQVSRGLRRDENWNVIRKKIEEAFQQGECLNPEIYTAYGLRAEELFPDGEMVDLTVSAYARVHLCSRDQDQKKEAVEDARFRLGLIHVWQDRCDLADAPLEKISFENGRYQTRALYWRAWCAQKTGNHLAFERLRNQLLKSNPLAFHGLHLNRNQASEFWGMLYQEGPSVHFRTEFDPTYAERINRVVRLVEVLQRAGETRATDEFLEYLVNASENTEVEFRLYLALLSHRSERRIPQFRMLSKIFQEDPSYISADVLKLFYPLQQFNILSKHEGRIDPYFLAALIRQESGFVPYARSSAGALGLMQLMPATARRMARVSRQDLLRPQINVNLGVKYLGQLLDRFDGDAELALAAYNAGPSRVDDWMKRYPTENRMLFLDLIPFSETRQYITLINRNFFWYQSLYAKEAQHPFLPKRQPASSNPQEPKRRLVFGSMRH